MRRAGNVAAYLASTTILIFLGLELALRAVFPDPEHYWDYRFLFVSPNTYRNVGPELWTYRPHATIRDVGVYAMAGILPPQPRIDVEYDCLMKSNNLGLIQDDDVARGERVTLILGDSYAEGQGGCPWFSRLQAARPGERLVNGGLKGTGFPHWKRMIPYLQQQGLVIERILVIAISDDFRRPASAKGDDPCLNDGTCTPRSYEHPVGDNEAHSSLIARTQQRLKDRFPNLHAPQFVWLWFRQNSHALKLLIRAKDAIRALVAGRASEVIHPETPQALEIMKSLGGPLHVMLVPARIEAGALGALGSTQKARQLLDAHGVPHSWCDLAGADFLPHDGHPNSTGYAKIADCAAQRLDRLH
jgi:hypothetical protein